MAIREVPTKVCIRCKTLRDDGPCECGVNAAYDGIAWLCTQCGTVHPSLGGAEGCCSEEENGVRRRLYLNPDGTPHRAEYSLQNAGVWWEVVFLRWTSGEVRFTWSSVAPARIDDAHRFKLALEWAITDARHL